MRYATSIGFLFLTLTLAGCGGGAPGPSGGKAEVPTAQAIAKHKYWEVKVTPKQIDDVVEKIVGLTRGVALVIDETFKVEVQNAFDNRTLRELLGTQRRVIFDMDRYAVRPAREQILKDFARMLDEEEFKPKRQEPKPWQLPDGPPKLNPPD